MSKMDFCAVITGDVIGSRKRGPDKWMPALKGVLSQFGDTPTDWDIYRGDGFQVKVKDPSDGLITALKIKSGLKSNQGLDARMAIGIGDMTYESSRVGESSGDAFVFSGALVEKLDGMHVTLAVATPWPNFDIDMNMSLALAAALMDRWLPNYAKAISAHLAHPELTQVQLGDTLGLAQNTLSERLSRAHKRELMQFEKVFRLKLKEYIKRALG